MLIIQYKRIKYIKGIKYMIIRNVNENVEYFFDSPQIQVW